MAATYTFQRYCMRCSRLSTDSSSPGPSAIFLAGLPTSPRWSFGKGSFPIAREVLDDLQASADHMVAHDVVGALCLRANNGSRDFIMLMKRILRAAGDKLKRAKRCEPLPEAPRHRSDAWIVCTQIDSLMKFVIHGGKVFIATDDSFLSLGVENLETLLLQRAHPDRA